MAKIFYISGLRGTITHDSTPEYDPWGPGSGWTCEEWKQWHMAMVPFYGRDQANLIFKQAWDAQGMFDSAYNWCKYNKPWVDYFLSQGLDLRSVLSAIIVPVTYLPGDVIEHTGDTISSLAKLIKPLTYAALLGAAYLGYKELKKQKAI